MSMSSLFQKLNLGLPESILVLNAPDSFESELDQLEDIKILRTATSKTRMNFGIGFALKQAELDRVSTTLARAAEGDAVLWIAYPKKSSKKFQCEFNRDSGWKVLGAAGFEPVRMVSIDENWSALRFRRAEHIKSLTRSNSMTISAAGDLRTKLQTAKQTIPAVKTPVQMAKTRQKTDSKTTETKIESFVAEFDPQLAKTIRSCRKELRKQLPNAVEQVYDNYNFLAIGFCTTERTSDCIVSLACSAKGVALSFYYGAALADPAGLLLGSGKQNRFIRLENAALLKSPAVVSLIETAVTNSKTPFPSGQRGYTMIKSVSAKKRPRR